MGGVCELEHLAQLKFHPAPSQRYSLAVLCQRLLSRHVRALSTARAHPCPNPTTRASIPIVPYPGLTLPQRSTAVDA
jgi:hypothetical protein